jgi:plasmid replication initiation protein
MASELVVKDNNLVEASYRLTLTEQRLILCGIVEARENGRGINDKTYASITAKRFTEMFPDVPLDNAYHMLKTACDTLMRRQVTMPGFDPETGVPCTVKVQWVYKSYYVPKFAAIRLRFTEDMVPLITRLESHFTAYRLELVAKLTSTHAIRLYELLVQYRQIGERKFSIEELKNILGLEKTEYSGRTAISDFKKWVIDPSVKQINEHTDLLVGYENIKAGRSVVGLLFTIEEKKPLAALQTKTTGKRPKITKAYIEKNARPGETYEQAYQRLSAEAN